MCLQSMSMKEQVQKYGQTEGLSTSNTELQKSNQNQQLNTSVNTTILTHRKIKLPQII